MKRWPLNKTYFWETAPFFRLLLPFAAGILCYDQGWLKPQGAFTLAASMLVLLLFVLISRFRPSLRSVSFVFAGALLLCLGNACAWYSDVNNDSRWFGHMQHRSACMVRVTEKPVLRPTVKDYIWRIPVTVVCQPGISDVQWVTGKAILYVRNENNISKVHLGDTFIVPGNWEYIKNAGNPFEFDYARYCARNGLYYRQFADPDDVHLYASQNPAALPLTEKAHSWCIAQFDRYIPIGQARGLIEAMMLGDEVNLDEDMRDAYAMTGIIHIIAISGGNVAIFFIIISGLLWWLRDKRYRWVKYAIALPLVWFYVVMAGSSPSAIRAAVMFSLIAFAVMFQRNNNSLNSIFATAFLLLCAQPMWLFSLGFQLSFAAVLSLIIFYRYVHRWWAPSAWVFRNLWPVIAASIAAQVLVAPLIIYYFHSFPPMFLAANAAAYLFMGLVLVLSVVLLAVSWLPTLAGLIGAVLEFLVHTFGGIISLLQHLSPGSWRTLLLTAVELALVYIIIAGISTFFARKQKPGLFIALGASCLLLCSFCVGRWQRLRQDRLVVYNTAGENYAELIRGNTFTPLTQRYRSNEKRMYALPPAHINWQAEKKDTAAPTNAYNVAGHSVLLLNRPVNTGRFPVDVLVINYVGNLDPEKLKQIFSPAKVVIGANYSRQQQQQLASAFNNAGIQAHAVSIDGAYILDK